MRKYYSPAFKAKVVTELLKEEKTIGQIAAETGVSAKQLNRWRELALTELPRLFETSGDDTQAKYEQKINQLYAEIGRLSTQLSWLKKKSGLYHEPD